MIKFLAPIVVLLTSLSSFAVQATRFSYDRSHESQEVSTFWSQHKVGVGVQAAGTYGVLGGVIGIHFHPQWSVDLGYGGGTHFQAFGIRVKKLLLLSSPLNPYFGFGFHRWYRNSQRPFNSQDVSPGYVGDRLMSNEDKRLGRIDEKLVHGSLGLQYVFTKGEMAGYGIFGEIVLLMDIEELISVPTASMGFNYFF